MNLLYFDTNKGLDLSTKAFFDGKIKELFQVEENGNFSVILHNDPINGVEYVTKVIYNTRDQSNLKEYS